MATFSNREAFYGGHDKEPRTCDAALIRAFGILGKRWNGLILETLLAGPAGYSEIRRTVAGISDSVLSKRLTELTDRGLVLRSLDEGLSGRGEYTLTGAGHALRPALEELIRWAVENLSD
ncbi:winged helix-turn-helix transcriptional regulator [Rhodococcus opacus]|uniref:Transcriptional regulator n=1 Tax=Rhodococcus opacus TaxID=37919 RepID=A0A2S8IIK0_RHOOP|nr:helix-turn-helix domain-containing protein [Rhodococcus opacus]PQP14509.1 transcriptional regulator [Rhodococcus opacus]